MCAAFTFMYLALLCKALIKLREKKRMTENVEKKLKELIKAREKIL